MESTRLEVDQISQLWICYSDQVIARFILDESQLEVMIWWLLSFRVEVNKCHIIAPIVLSLDYLTEFREVRDSFNF